MHGSQRMTVRGPPHRIQVSRSDIHRTITWSKKIHGGAYVYGFGGPFQRTPAPGEQLDPSLASLLYLPTQTTSHARRSILKNCQPWSCAQVLVPIKHVFTRNVPPCQPMEPSCTEDILVWFVGCWMAALCFLFVPLLLSSLSMPGHYCFLRVLPRKQNRPGIAPNDTTTHVPTA